MDFDTFSGDSISYDYDLKCPVCGSNQVVININSSGYYNISKCIKCGYQTAVVKV